MNRAVFTGLGSIALAQGLKVPIRFLQTGKWNWSALFQTGGMPSSHSAGVSALATYIALKKGVSAIDFAVSTIFGLIVMYDAMGIRRHAGEMAVELNELDAQMEKLADRHPGVYHARRAEALKEQLGHLPQEVAAGALLGAACGAASRLLELRNAWSKVR
ncbi:divergent PAP2 family protein [Paenibacillus thermotolerans]|uniref:divergent PAP2 family protein n=1 Tax=Paenibacillus thermotolerans TaxID=3027807 RepID=UPI002368A68F|nr:MULTISPECIES: divergent PAP2 family protein [unclassified Paenibacillus]